MLADVCRVVHDIYQVGNDGRARWERVADKRSERPLEEFGEKVMPMAKGPRSEQIWPLETCLGLVSGPQKVLVASGLGRQGSPGGWSGSRRPGRTGPARS